jgi:hypothetical protein
VPAPPLAETHHLPKPPAAKTVSYDEASPAPSAALGADIVATPSPPLLAPAPPFAPLDPRPAASPTANSQPQVDDATMARLEQMRKRLEQLGAEHVFVEMLESGSFRFECRMLVDDRSRFTRPFEATAHDPLAAGEQVLRSVEAWRAAGSQSAALRLPQ